ncbi:hypothetical protein Acr_08g0001610 [Actinidia rufa]|uniref:non-specific serine/threonine protein kinase n=1 Tax=Actinidia rufa TaxID=165716 RepID=A0A7J0EZ94_9ERIC|nr:hypothetical protein Acr_08g0001580 [Actinidia rufa]GFY91765.1 hypothetical protein Acr_08g0001610 [Actinidia rufa]
MTWNPRLGIWNSIVALRGDTCDGYNLCGSYGLCNTNKQPICHCPDGFEPRQPLDWKRLTWTGGCVRTTEPNCSTPQGFMKVSGLKLPDTSYFLVNSGMSKVDCEAACLRNCSCMGYAKTDISGCVVWFGELLDIREYNEGGQDLYIRMAASELADCSKARR